MRVCSLHFHLGKPSYEMLENHPDWKPSLRLGHSEVKQTDEVRFLRQVNRRTQHQEQPPSPAQHQEQPPSPGQDQEQPPSPAQHQEQPPSPGQHQEQPPSPAQHQEQPPSPAQHQEQPPSPGQHQEQPPSPGQHQEQPPSPAQECALCSSRRDVINSLLEENRKLKEELEEYQMNENFLSGDDNRVKYYMGLPTYLMFQTLLLSLMPYLPQGSLKKLSPFQLVLMTLMRLRLDLPIQHLGRLFRVHRTTASDAFHHTLSVMYSRLSPLVYWPSRESLLTSMPHQFVESFGKHVAAIVDCFEVFIEKPSNVLARAQTFSPGCNFFHIRRVGWARW
uniref:Transposase Helix-turn-helix domain-containing protein n=1 Tax=Cyprinus carpio carpio TaxID=630221 RepID=A0A9J7WYY9_CYPCA